MIKHTLNYRNLLWYLLFKRLLENIYFQINVTYCIEPILFFYYTLSFLNTNAWNPLRKIFSFWKCNFYYISIWDDLTLSK